VGVRVTCAEGHEVGSRDVEVGPGPSAILRPA